MIHTATCLEDFDIKDPAEIAVEGSCGSVWASRRADGMDVVLHRFTPASILLDLGPQVQLLLTPEFHAPFVTFFIGAFQADGSAYLAEAVPKCARLADAWKAVLLQQPDDALKFAKVTILNVVNLIGSLKLNRSKHGAVRLETIILTEQGVYGLLAGHLDSEHGPIWLRPPLPNQIIECDRTSLGWTVLHLAAIEEQTAREQQRMIFTQDERDTLRTFSNLLLSTAW